MINWNRKVIALVSMQLGCSSYALRPIRTAAAIVQLPVPSGESTSLGELSYGNAVNVEQRPEIRSQLSERCSFSISLDQRDDDIQALPIDILEMVAAARSLELGIELIRAHLSPVAGRPSATYVTGSGDVRLAVVYNNPFVIMLLSESLNSSTCREAADVFQNSIVFPRDTSVANRAVTGSVPQ